jgi:LAO/AO transport system kinase
LRPSSVHSTNWKSKVMTCSALKNYRIDSVWDMIQDCCRQAKIDKVFDVKRAQQNTQWMDSLFKHAVLSEVMAKPGFNELKNELKKQVIAGIITPLAAAQKLVKI